MKHLMAVKLAFLMLLFNICIISSIDVNTVLAYDISLPVYVNEEPSGYNAIVVKGELYIKLRDICDIYFVEIDYDDTTQTITIYDKPTPTKLKLLGDKVAENKKMFVEDGSVYVSLKSVPTFNGWHKQQGHWDVQRTFSFNNGSWSLSNMCQQVGDYQYVVYDRTSYADPTHNTNYLWQFKPNGRCRAVAIGKYITSFVVDGDDVFIVEKFPLNGSSVVKFSLIDGTATRLGQLGYDYGDNLRWAAHYSPEIEPLFHNGIVVRDDVVYTVGYSREGFFENNIIDKDIFLETYGYYRLPRDGGAHERVSEWPE